MTSQGRACPVNVGVSQPKCPNKVGTARTQTHTHTHTHTHIHTHCFNGHFPGEHGLDSFYLVFLLHLFVTYTSS